MALKRNSVIPTPQNDDDSILVSFMDEKGRLRNETIVDKSIAAKYDAHQKELDALAEEYTQKREAITNNRPIIDSLAFAKAEAAIEKREREAKEAAAKAKAEASATETE